ncbi:hypothetical protein PPYR_15006 [Photinus pyralis]|nr:hypothetical protein PPYR_15006 [Photinus pyralis]
MEFYEIARFPGVTGCIDGTHIPIRSPGGDRAEVFRNRKGYFSINCQATGNLSGLLLGDSAHAQSRFMFTPVPEPNNIADQAYNAAQVRTRNVVERTFGQWNNASVAYK